jgi:hypothetical protein
MMNSFLGMMGGGMTFGWITILLLWVLMGLGIAALWKYISKK